MASQKTKSKRLKKPTESSIYSDLVSAASELTKDDLRGVAKPYQALGASTAHWILPSPKVKTDQVELMKTNKKLFGRRMSTVDDVSLHGDVDEMFLKEASDTEDENDVHYFTLAKPYLEINDQPTTYTNPNYAFPSSNASSASSSSRMRRHFKSVSELHKGDSRWDGPELVNEKILDRKQVKDVRGASRRLLELEEKMKLNINTKGQQNPTFDDPVYGVENIKSKPKIPSSKKESSASEALEQPPVDCPYVPTAKIPKGINPADFAYGKEAYQLYLTNRRHLDRMEKTDIEPQINLLRQRLITKRDQIEEAVHKAREFYSSDYQPRMSLKARFLRVKEYFTDPDYTGPKSLQRGYSQTDVRRRLEDLPTYTPWFIYIITLLQAICIAKLCASFGVVPPRLVHQKLVVEDIVTWSGVRAIEHFVPPNMWAGPSHAKLMRGGALYAPCLREDKYHLLRNAIYEAKNSDLGCCEASGRGAGTTTKQECDEIKTLYEVSVIEWKNVTCTKRSKSTGVYVPHDFKPCCLGGKGDCILVSHKHCVILSGTWHISEYQHCSEAKCDADSCRVYENDDHSDGITTNSQFWRLPVSLMYHEGIMHMILFAIVQGYVGVDIERLAGWLRMSAIYIICGMGGLLMGSVMVPYVPNLGTGGAICGLISVHAGELLQSWPLVRDKYRATVKVLLLYTLMISFGLLPGVNQFTNLGGALLGILCSLAVMPYLPFTRRHHWLMFALRVLSLIGLIIFISALLYLFYVTQPNATGSVRFLNCLTFVEFACDPDLP